MIQDFNIFLEISFQGLFLLCYEFFNKSWKKIMNPQNCGIHNLVVFQDFHWGHLGILKKISFKCNPTWSIKKYYKEENGDFSQV